MKVFFFILFLLVNTTASAQLFVTGQQKISYSEGYTPGFMSLSSPDFDRYRFGTAVSNMGDIDGDGFFEILVGGEGDADGGPRRGSVWVMSLNPDGTVRSSVKYSDPVITGLVNGNHFGWSSAAADVDGDGITDIIVSTEDDNEAGFRQGAAWVILLNADGTVQNQQKINMLSGGLTGPISDEDLFGWSVAAIGDLNGDGFEDIVVGAMWDDDGGTNRGAVYVLLLDDTGSVIGEQKISDTQGGLSASLQDQDWFGVAVSGIGDFNGDGLPDIAVGSRDGGFGAVYVLSLNSAGNVVEEWKIDPPTGVSPGDHFGGLEGRAIALLGDINCDGVDDLAVGAPGTNSGQGAIHILLMNADGTVDSSYLIPAAPGVSNGDHFGASVALLEDIDGNGVRDLAVGSSRDSDGGQFNGAVRILFMDVPRLTVAGETSFCPGDELTVTASGAGTYEWFLEGDPVPVHNDSVFTVVLDAPANYIVRGEDCLVDTVRFTQRSEAACFDIFVYKLVTPNGDDKNDFFRVENIERFPDNKLYILNRLGETVFRTEGYDNSWDGGNLPDGTYFYLLEVEGKSEPYKGSFQLRR